MGTVTLIAKVAFPYDGKSLAVGDLFTASERDAHTLKLIGRAADAPRLRKSVARKDLEREPVAATETDDHPKRTYRRRDLVAEGSEE